MAVANYLEDSTWEVFDAFVGSIEMAIGMEFLQAETYCRKFVCSRFQDGRIGFVEVAEGGRGADG